MYHIGFQHQRRIGTEGDRLTADSARPSAGKNYSLQC
jgi:hypothetical protein